MAQAAEDTLQVSRIQLYANIVGLFVVVATLIATAYTGYAARIAAQAAVDAVGAERAWLSHLSHSISSAEATLNGVNHKDALLFSLTIKNLGRSPALRTKVFRQAQIVGADDPMPEFKPEIDLDTGSVCGPNIIYTTQPYGIGGKDLQDFISGHKELAFYVHVSYETTEAQGVRRVTETCGKFICTGSAEREGGGFSPIIRFSPVGPQNTAT
jgi:hypothetical protein